MRIPRPRSLSSLLALALLLLLVPVGIALVQAAAQLRQLAQETDQLVRQGVELAGQTQALFRLLSTFERSANLYLVLGDPRVLEANRATQEQIYSVTDRLAALPVDSEAQAQLSDLRRAVAGALATVTFDIQPDVDRAVLLSARLDDMNAAAGGLSAATNAVLDVRLKSLETKATETRQTLFMWLAAVVPAALVLGVLFTIAVLRPLRRVDRVITELGGGSFSKPIVIKGPSDIEALGRQLEWLRVRLLELAQEKNRFLRHVSHELKTPLANLREGTDLLLDGAVGPLDDNQLEVAGILRDNAIRLQRLIENLLSYSARQSSSSDFDISRFPLSSLVGTVTDAQRLALAARDIHLDIDVSDILLAGDRGKLKLVLDNLLSNALKFTPRGGTIHIHGHREGDRALIDFADTGPGIPEEERGRVFDDFFTGTAPQTGPLKGTGIGLSVVREFVQAHGGTVEIAAGRFPGAHFRITLPLEGTSRNPERLMPRSLALFVVSLALALPGCSGTVPWAHGGRKAPEPVSAAPSEAEVVAAHLEAISRLGAGTPAEQAETVDSARRAYLDAPTPSHQLRYACVLASPGHGGSDPAGARTLLGELLATPERLGPAERSLAQVVYREVNAQLSLESELRELRNAKDAADREHAAAASQRLQAQAAEIARLRKELDDARAKLEAIAELERNLVSRPAPDGDRP